MNNTVNNTLNLYPIDYPFETLVDRVTKDKLLLNPEFQRKYKWDKDGNERASKFIESCLMRIPLPACYFAEDEDNRHIVIDGVQRITTIKNFFNDEFALEGLTVFRDLEGKKFSELGNYRSDLETTTIRCIILRKENPKELIQEIFARLNQGAVQLSSQEIRHAIYPGALDNLLVELSQLEDIKQFGIGEQSKKIKDSREDEELVLRFFALNSDLSDYNNNFTKYLDDYMLNNQNMIKEDVNNNRDLFISTLNKCKAAFEQDVFCNLSTGRKQQGLIFYDLQMWGFIDINEDIIIRNKQQIVLDFIELCQQSEFQKTLSGGTLQKGAINKRRQLWREKLDLYV